jgi:hypothetical protein
MTDNTHTGDPAVYAGRVATPRPPLLSAAPTPDAAASASAASGVAAQTGIGLPGGPQIAGTTTRSTPSGLDVTVRLTRNDDSLPDVWLADLALGAVAERMRSDQIVVSDIISSATAVGPGRGGETVTTDLGIGAVRPGQVFGSPSDATLTARVADVAKRFELTVADLEVLHPLESALSVTFVVPDGAKIEWTIDELGTALEGQPPNVEGSLIELDDSRGQPLLRTCAAYRTGDGGLWFAPGQDERFGAVYSHTPGK